MPLSPLHSNEWLQFTAVPPIKAQPHKAGRLYISSATLTFTGAGQGTAKMLRLPPGKVRIWSDLSRIVCPQGTASAVLSVGYAAYTNEAGTAVVANPAALASALTIGSAAQDVVLPLPAGGFLDVDSQNGIDIECLIATANSPAAGDMTLSIAYTRAG
jgi:hypothetical protein